MSENESQARPKVGFKSSAGAPLPPLGGAFLALGSVISSSGGGYRLNFNQQPYSFDTYSSSSTNS